MRLETILASAAALSIAATGAQAERGADGQLNLLYWQAASILNPYLSGGTKDLEAASLILDPLANYDEAGNMVPVLVTEIPTIENGGVSEDLTTITWTLRDDILWSDGTPLTAEDVKFSAEYCMHPDGGCNSAAKFTDVESVEAVDVQTVRITFSVPKPFPYGPLVGAMSPVIQRAQFADCLGEKATACTEANFNPIGTGPFRVTEFKANDVVTLEANPNYRDPDKPAFATVVFKGGGDAASAARAVLETGEFDYAWNLQVEPEILDAMAAAGKGTVVSSFGPAVERLVVNLSDPDPSLGEARSTVAHPHPFLTDPAVTRALSLAIDRQILVDAGYGSAGKVTCNILPAPEMMVSTANDWCMTPDVDEANRLLDEAGWVRGADGVREKDGVRLSILFVSSVNSVRQGTQALVKQMWQAIGVETELRSIDASVFFGSDPSSPDTIQKFYADIEMYTNTFDGTDPEKYMANWQCGEIPSPENQWVGSNIPRFCSEQYDALVAEMGKTASLEERAALARRMNDLLIAAGAFIPLVHRGDVSAHAASIRGVRMNSWDSELWNVEDWTRAQ
ncbi:peptide ABC transporter substrate-binding protein [Rhodobacteraceae bacterium 2CG4]|uniref:Peptide ABC transporter substrate-binding protein n=1 Tax=Halovulum marinum TaxID=2662447 RepID=A0A6L5YZ15_9RHOB|nr:peptide ABC transporter substrate-binding protein [Halovulum marinum]MSU89150.1 peptide ABC transporter substrate-binding protein [Halovulum marinum]